MILIIIFRWSRVPVRPAPVARCAATAAAGARVPPLVQATWTFLGDNITMATAPQQPGPWRPSHRRHGDGLYTHQQQHPPPPRQPAPPQQQQQQLQQQHCGARPQQPVISVTQIVSPLRVSAVSWFVVTAPVIGRLSRHWAAGAQWAAWATH